MSCPLNPEDLNKFKGFIKTCEKCPQILWVPEFQFFRDYVESLGGTIPKVEEKPFPTSGSSTTESTCPKADEPMNEEEESEESEVELDMEGVLEPETIDAPEMGDSSKVVSEEDEMAASEKRSEAMAAVGDGELDKAVELFTEAIKLNPTSAMLYAKRASILLKQKRVKAALIDCDEAIKLNPDSATAHKFRGRTHRFLGNWLEAATELRLACKLDFDEQSDEWLKEVQPNATKLEEHKRKYERKTQEKLIKERNDRMKKAREEYKKAQENEKAHGKSFPGGMPFGMPGMPGGMPGMPGGMPGMPGGMPGMPGGMPGMPGGMPGMPGGMPGMAGGMPDFAQIFKDPEIMSAMQDPEVAAAFQDVSTNPANIFKYQSNPKISGVINKLIKNFGGGAMPGGMSDMPDDLPDDPSVPTTSSDDLD